VLQATYNHEKIKEKRGKVLRFLGFYLTNLKKEKQKLKISHNFCEERQKKRLKQTADVMAAICGLRWQLRLDSADHTQLVWYKAFLFLCIVL